MKCSNTLSLSFVLSLWGLLTYVRQFIRHPKTKAPSPQLRTPHHLALQPPEPCVPSDVMCTLFLALLLFFPIHVLSCECVFLVHLYPPLNSQKLAPSLQLSRSKRREKVYQTLSRVVNDVQRRVGSFIKAQNEDTVVVLPLWIQNTLVVRYNEDNCTLKSFFDRALQGFQGC